MGELKVPGLPGPGPEAARAPILPLSSPLRNLGPLLSPAPALWTAAEHQGYDVIGPRDGRPRRMAVAPNQEGCEVSRKQKLKGAAQCVWSSATSASGHGATQILDLD